MSRFTNTITRGFLIGACLVMVCSCQGRIQAADVLRAGAATSNITPPIGGGIVGGFVPVPSTHIHDELHARASCWKMETPGWHLLCVICSVFIANVSDQARELIESRLGIPRQNVLISATHTHSATSALGQSRYQMQIALDDYQNFVVQRIVDGVHRAVNQLEPARIAFGTAEAPDHVFNRRWRMREGTVP